MKAADKGDMQSQVNVANAYYLGNGTETDHHKAFLWYREALPSKDMYKVRRTAVRHIGMAMA